MGVHDFKKRNYILLFYKEFTQIFILIRIHSKILLSLYLIVYKLLGFI
jgi:hypothetical protein